MKIFQLLFSLYVVDHIHWNNPPEIQEIIGKFDVILTVHRR